MSALQTFPAPLRAVDAESVARALFSPIADLPLEVAMFAYLDPRWRLLAMRTTPFGSADTLDLPVRTVVGDVIAFEAAGVVMAHNHPSGDPTPSAADRALTRKLARALDGVGVRLIDHLILAGAEAASFRREGLL